MVNVRFLYYLRYSVWDYFLCLVAASGLCQTCLIAFQSTSSLQAWPLISVGACAVALLVLFAIAYRTETAIVGGIAFAIAVCGSSIAAWYVSGAQSLFSDGANNGAYAVLMLVWPSVLVFLLSRKRTGAVVLLVVGFILCAAMEYLYWQGKVLVVVAFGVGSAALIAYRNYQMGLKGSQSERLMFGQAAASGVAVVLASLLLACGFFAVVIGPLDPPHVTVKLITQHVRIDEEHLRGVGDSLSAQNSELFSLNTNDEQQKSNGSDAQTSTQESEENAQTATDQTVANAGSALNINNQSEQDAGQAVSTQVPDYAFAIVTVLLLALIAAVISIRKALRTRWLRKVKALSPQQQVRALFLFFVVSFKKMKLPVPGAQTLHEYVEGASQLIVDFEGRASDPEFACLADAYTSVVYGGAEPSQEDLERFYSYYGYFHKRACHYVGRIKYLLLFFRI